MADDTPWLDDEEINAWIPFASMLLTLPGALDAQLQRDSGLTFYEYTVLAGLSSAGDDGLRVSDLAAVTSGGLSRLSQVVTRMSTRDWVARRPDPTDGRAARVVLRPTGRKVLEAAAPGHVRTVRALVFDHLNPTQVQHLRRISERVAAAVTGPDTLIQARAAARGPGRTRTPRAR